jgi:D-3-phosphoglycerate dehydrogenase / 2-oxoglutarate reductase
MTRHGGRRTIRPLSAVTRRRRGGAAPIPSTPEEIRVMTKPRVVLVHPASKMFPYEVWPAAFDGIDVEIVSVECRTASEARDAVAGADVVMVGGFRVDAAMIARMDRARVICGFGHGFEGVDLDAATRAGILVTNAAHICHLEVANHAAALILALNRKIVHYDRAMRQGVWDRPAGRPITPLDGETAGLVGLGAIGQALARRLQPFGLRVIAYDPYVEEHVPRELGVRMVGDLHGLLGESDWVSVQVPLNGETRHLLGERELRAMKPTAHLVNCCRGGVVDEAALARALQQGWLAGAGLDVFEQEPTPAENPLLRMPNVIATPHAAGESTESGALSARVASKQAAAVLRGEWPDRVVNPAVFGRLREIGGLAR